MRYRIIGVLLFIIAGLIAFSGLYLFIHFPTDVLFGAGMGAALGFASGKLEYGTEKEKSDD